MLTQRETEFNFGNREAENNFKRIGFCPLRVLSRAINFNGNEQGSPFCYDFSKPQSHQTSRALIVLQFYYLELMLKQYPELQEAIQTFLKTNGHKSFLQRMQAANEEPLNFLLIELEKYLPNANNVRTTKPDEKIPTPSTPDTDTKTSTSSTNHVDKLALTIIDPNASTSLTPFVQTNVEDRIEFVLRVINNLKLLRDDHDDDDENLLKKLTLLNDIKAVREKLNRNRNDNLYKLITNLIESEKTLEDKIQDTYGKLNSKAELFLQITCAVTKKSDPYYNGMKGITYPTCYEHKDIESTSLDNKEDAKKGATIQKMHGYISTHFGHFENFKRDIEELNTILDTILNAPPNSPLKSQLTTLLGIKTLDELFESAANIVEEKHSAAASSGAEQSQSSAAADTKSSPPLKRKKINLHSQLYQTLQHFNLIKNLALLFNVILKPNIRLKRKKPSCSTN